MPFKIKKLDFFINTLHTHEKLHDLNSENLKNVNKRKDNDCIIIKFLKENSDFFPSKLDRYYLPEFLSQLSKIESKVPLKHVIKLSESINDKNIEPRIIIEKVFEKNFDDDIIKILISNFENNLLGQSKQANRLILFYKITEKKFVLIHTTKKEQLCSESFEDYQSLIIKESFLDFRDYLRIIFFELKNSDVIFKIMEYSDSSFFKRWLKFSKIRKSYNNPLLIEVKLNKSNNLPIIYDPSEFYKDIMENKKEVNENKLIFCDLIKDNIKFLEIKRITYNEKIYEGKYGYKLFLEKLIMNQKFPSLSILNDEFKNFINRQSYDISGWSQEVSNKRPSLFENANSVYSTSIESINFQKRKINGFDFILGSGEHKFYSIHPDDAYIKQLANAVFDFKNTYSLVKLGETFRYREPFRVNNLIIYNKIELMETYSIIDDNITKLARKRDSDIQYMINYFRFFLFQRMVLNPDFKVLFKNILLKSNLILKSSVYYDKEDKILEFKNKKFFENKSKDEINEKFQNIAKKYCHLNFKFTIIGLDEQNSIDGIDKKFIHSDWFNYYEENLNIFLKPYNKKAFIQHLPIEYNSKKTFIILFIMY